MKNTKALVLFSGGLDSLLAVKILQAQDITVAGVCFESIFFNANKAIEAAKKLDIKLKVVNISPQILALVKNPPNGYGKHLNPCIDCHSLMVKTAAMIARKEKFSFVATGEVLGQRPFSQTRAALEAVDKFSGIEILRPLSAKLLEKTQMEKKRLVNRGRLLGISGRRRGRQIELARKYKVKDIPNPAGGCLLTDPDFSGRLIKMLDYWPDCGPGDAELLKNGRVYWIALRGFSQKALVVIGRYLADNENLEKLAIKGDIVLKLKEIAGPTVLIRAKEPNKFKNSLNKPGKEINLYIPDTLKMSSLKLGEEKDLKEITEIVSLLAGYYSTKARGKNITMEISEKN